MQGDEVKARVKTYPRFSQTGSDHAELVVDDLTVSQLNPVSNS